MAADASGYWFLDGIDLWTSFGMLIEEGSANLLRYPPKKESITHDWMDADGIEVDLSRVFFGPREIPLVMGIIASSEEDFWLKHNAFISQLTQPGIRRLTISAHGERSYYIYYKECNNYNPVKALQGKEGARFVGAKFTVVIVEPKPDIDNTHVFIVDEDGRFLIT